MEDFLHGRGLESHMKMHFVKRTFSKHVLQWWVELQQGHIARDEEHCRTWKGMKMVLRDRYDPIIEKIMHAYETKTTTYDNNSLDPKSGTPSSWRASIIGEECFNGTKQHCAFTAVENENRLLHSKKDRVVVPLQYSSPKQQGKKFEIACADNFCFYKEDTKINSDAMDVQVKKVTKCAKIPSTLGLQVVDSSFPSFDEHSINVVDDSTNGLSMMAQEVHRDGTIAIVKGQRCN